MWGWLVGPGPHHRDIWIFINVVTVQFVIVVLQFISAACTYSGVSWTRRAEVANDLPHYYCIGALTLSKRELAGKGW